VAAGVREAVVEFGRFGDGRGVVREGARGAAWFAGDDHAGDVLCARRSMYLTVLVARREISRGSSLCRAATSKAATTNSPSGTIL